MAVEDYDVLAPPLINQPAFGVDESLSEIEMEQVDPVPMSHHYARVAGVFPPYYDIKAIYEQTDDAGSGALQRLFGKKLIDANPNQKVFAIAQAYNGFGQYGYYVQTDQKLYFHQCESPKSLSFSLATLQSLGTDENGLSLDIFGHQSSSAAVPPDTSISCVFDFPTGDKPDAPDTAHPGVDFLLISVTPANAPNVDTRLRTRLLALNTGSGYDNQEIGFYKTQNACRGDSVPLVAGPDGAYLYPPTNAKNAFLAWGGPVFKNTWTNFNPTNNVWTQTTDAWQSVGAPGITNPYAGYLQYHYSTFQGGTNYQGKVWSPNSSGRAYIDTAFQGANYWQYTGTQVKDQFGGFLGYQANASSGPALSFPNGGFPAATNSNRYGLSGLTIMQDFQSYKDNSAQWQQPFNTSYAITWSWSNQSARTSEGGRTSSSNVNKYGYEKDNSTYYQLKKFASWVYGDATSMQNSSHVSGDVNKYAHRTDVNQWFQLTTVGVPVTVTWSYTSATARLNAAGLIPTDINKNSHQTDNDTYWRLDDMNAHATNTDYREYYLINLNRLFTDYQQITPASIQFMLRGYWDDRKTGSGVVNIVVTSFKSGLVQRSDSIVWGMDTGATQKDQKTLNPALTRIAVGADAKGDNLALITCTMADGTLNVTAPTANTDGGDICPF